MLTVRKRGTVYYAINWSRNLRLSLGTRHQDAAQRFATRIDKALAEGPGSALWAELKTALPEPTFARFAEIAGYNPAPEAPKPTWADLRASFETHIHQQISIGKLRESTAERYGQTIREFETFLSEKETALLSEIHKPLVEQFKVWRVERIKAKKQSRGGTGLALDAAILHRVFAFAVENEMVAKNPVRLEGRPGDSPENGAQPFTAEEITKLRQATGADMLAFLLLRHTGLRGSDAVGLTWAEIDWDTREIVRLTQKRRKRVVVPIHRELLFALESEHERRNPAPDERVLLNPTSGEPLTRPRLYERMLALGKRAGVANANPHRYRDFFAVDLLAKGGTPYDVAKQLGDTIQTVEKHYAPFVRELRERVRRIMESGAGIEGTVSTLLHTKTAQLPAKPPQIQ